MPLNAKEVAHFIVTQGGWEHDRYGATEGRNYICLRLEGITQGKQELLQELKELLPSMYDMHVTDRVSTNPSDLKGTGDLVLAVEERELRKVQKLISSTVWRGGGRPR
jgi:hypothetical protein